VTEERTYSAAAMQAVIELGSLDYMLASACRHDARDELERARQRLAAAIATIDAALTPVEVEGVPA
jgi:hypothetical protein